MSLIKYLSVSFCSIILLTSCNSGSVDKLWFFTHTEGAEAADADLTPVSFLYLQSDGQYTMDFGTFDYGKWIRKGDEIRLASSQKGHKSLQIKSVGTNELTIELKPGIVANFEAQQQSKASLAKNPYVAANNQWRIKATHKETEDELRERLKNHCKFWEAYFDWGMENKIDYLDVRSMPTPIKIYGNGIELKSFTDLPQAWKNYFYDTEDCRIANNLLYEVFQYHDISWAHTTNKYKMFLSAFQQIQRFLNY